MLVTRPFRAPYGTVLGFIWIHRCSVIFYLYPDNFECRIFYLCRNGFLSRPRAPLILFFSHRFDAYCEAKYVAFSSYYCDAKRELATFSLVPAVDGIAYRPPEVSKRRSSKVFRELSQSYRHKSREGLTASAYCPHTAKPYPSTNRSIRPGSMRPYGITYYNLILSFDVGR